MTTISNAVWELQMGVVVSAADLISGLNLLKMTQVTEVAQVAPPSVHINPVIAAVQRAPLADQQALVQAAIHFRTVYENLVGEPSTH